MTRADGDAARRPASVFADIRFRPGEDLVAAGGDLRPALVLDAYRHGLFPWYDADEPVLWWSPDPRAILPLDAFHVPRRLARSLAASADEVRVDTAFAEVMAACDELRPDGTWIHGAMQRTYGALHRLGVAHSLEVYRSGQLVGGIYGVAFGACFAAESMFHRVRDASKMALVHLVQHLRGRGFQLLDVQFLTPHLAQFGCVEVPRTAYLKRVHALRDEPVRF
ncbi:MAG: leucyl/phenylalanyl-tRNA--protein transferase [Planctomycetota bacterium]|nr:leucyl/phenylalanyl-tRNA--protein transferase [Planctomycetota bacterium]